MQHTPEQGGEIKVLYICGAGRSGSTILDRVLGQIDGFFSAGEIRVLWDRPLAEHLLCGCGVPLDSCPLWAEITRGIVGPSAVDPEAANRLRQSARTLATPLLMMPGGRKLLASIVRRHIHLVEALYRAIARTTGCRVIVDSSKVPAYSYLLSQVSAVKLYVVHLIRDPRAVAYSWQKAKPRPDMRQDTGGPRYMTRFGPVTSSLLWAMENMASESLWRKARQPYLRLHYEQFMLRPKAAVDAILSLLGESGSAQPFASEVDVKLAVNHTVAGNPDRVSTGLVRLRNDDEWRKRLAPGAKRAVEALTLPLLRRYGYGLTSRV